LKEILEMYASKNCNAAAEEAGAGANSITNQPKAPVAQCRWGLNSFGCGSNVP